ncbi:MAG: 50S ribosomal protein L18 [Candidatus Nealsonbacteria bacterium]|nr:50S ribosomal protein L18 [Candidatus Nealsonbacteria bacterium]
MSIKHEKRNRRHKRIRARIFGTSEKPRLCVFRSNQYIYAQLIDDEKNKIMASAKGESNVKEAKKAGAAIAKKAIEKKIEKVVFDRGGYKYHGRIKALADGAREGGLKF